MLKIGDIVRVKTDRFPGYNNSLFRIIRTYMLDTHKSELFVIVGLRSGTERHFKQESLEKDVMYYRKDKINKIYSKLKHK